jgi:hypothetical protein
MFYQLCQTTVFETETEHIGRTLQERKVTHHCWSWTLVPAESQHFALHKNASFCSGYDLWTHKNSQFKVFSMTYARNTQQQGVEAIDTLDVYANSSCVNANYHWLNANSRLRNLLRSDQLLFDLFDDRVNVTLDGIHA